MRADGKSQFLPSLEANPTLLRGQFKPAHPATQPVFLRHDVWAGGHRIDRINARVGGCESVGVVLVWSPTEVADDIEFGRQSPTAARPWEVGKIVRMKGEAMAEQKKIPPEDLDPRFHFRIVPALASREIEHGNPERIGACRLHLGRTQLALQVVQAKGKPAPKWFAGLPGPEFDSIIVCRRPPQGRKGSFDRLS